MERQAVDGGGWFDRSSARQWNEGQRWDGRNWISLHTGSQWAHERLYRSRSGRWILRQWSDWQGSEDSWTEITRADAAAWLVLAEHEIPPELAELVAGMEV